MVGGEQEQEAEEDKGTGRGSVYEPDWDRNRDRERDRDRDSRGRGGDDWRSRSASADREEGGWAGRSGRDQPSCTIHIRDIPEDRDEDDVRQLLDPFPGLLAVRLATRQNGASAGHAFAEFASEQDAAALMGSAARQGLELGGRRLRLCYAPTLSSAPGNASAAAGHTSAAPAPNAHLDWICDMCTAVNFARRVECHKCCTRRPANPQRVAADADHPSAILKVSNLEQHVSEDDLRALFMGTVSVRDVRIINDKYTGLPRGLAFVEMWGVSEAARALAVLQGAVPRGGSLPVRLCYARDKFGAAGPAGGAGAEALEAAQAMSMYSSWEPKAFDARALDGGSTTAAAKQQQQQQPRPQAQAQQGQQPAQAKQQQQQQQPQSGFVYDQASGYWYDAASGYYYDANTGLYYHQSTGQWYSYDHATGQYAAAGTGAAAAGGGQQAAGGTAVGAGVSGAGAGGAERKRGAVIGAAPVLNAQGLLAAAALAEEKSKQAAKAATKQGQAAKAGQAQGGKAAPGGPAGGAASAPQPAAPVQGVIHRGKWSQRS